MCCNKRPCLQDKERAFFNNNNNNKKIVLLHRWFATIPERFKDPGGQVG